MADEVPPKGRLTDGASPASWQRGAAKEIVPTEGMEKRRRDIERRRIERKRQEEELAEEAREGWTRVFRTVAILALLFGAWFLYKRTQLAHENQWPLMDVWIWAAVGVLGVIWWALRAISKG